MLSSSSPPFFCRRRETAVWARTTARQLDASSVQPARLLQPPAVTRLSSSSLDLALTVTEAGCPASVWYLDKDPQMHFWHAFLPALCTPACVWLRLFLKAGHMHACVYWHTLQCLGMPGYASSLLSTSFFLPLRHSDYLVKSLLSHFCLHWAQLELFRLPPWRQNSLWPQHLPMRCKLNFQCGVACKVSPLAWWVGPVVLAHRFHAGAVLKSIVFAWSIFPSDYSFVWLSVSIVPVLLSLWLLLSGTLYLFHWQKHWILARLRAAPVESHQKYFHLIEIPHWCLLLALSFSQFLIHLIYAWIKLCSALF